MSILYNICNKIYDLIFLIMIVFITITITISAQEHYNYIPYFNVENIIYIPNQVNEVIIANNQKTAIQKNQSSGVFKQPEKYNFDNSNPEYGFILLMVFVGGLVILIFGIVYVIILYSRNKSITYELKEKEKLLELKELEMSLSLDAAGIGVVKFDLINNKYYRDASFYNRLGYSRNDISKMESGVINILYEEDIELVKNIKKQLIESSIDTICNLNFKVYKKDGSLASLLLRAKITEFTADNKPKTMHGVIVDVTDKYRMESENNRLFELLKLALEEYGLSTWEWNREEENRIYYHFFSSKNNTSPIARKILINNHNEARFDIDVYTKYVHPDDSEAFKKFIKSYKTIAEKADNKMVQIQHKLIIDDMIYTIFLQGKAVEFKSDGYASRIIGIAHDITVRVNDEENKAQLKKLEAIGTLASRVAYDFNNQLNGILGFVDLLLKMDNLKDNVLVQKYLKIINECGKKCEGLTSQLLAFARKREKHELFDIHNAIDNIIAMLEHTIDRRITISKSLNSINYLMEGDKNQLENALLNIMLNSCDAMINGGVITIESDDEINKYLQKITLFKKYKNKNVILIKISDTGKGIENNLLKKIFEPFFTTKQIGKGTGMGLAIAFGVIKDHGGEVYVESKVGIGTEFYICLPIKKTIIKSDIVISDINNINYNKKILNTILVIDDDIAARILLKKNIQSYGCEVLTAKDGIEAEKIYRNKQDEISLIICDISTPYMNGPEILSMLKKINNEVRVLIIAGYTKHDDKIVFMINNGASACIKKPLNREKLYLGIRNALG